MNLYYRIRNHLWYIWLRFPTSVAVRRTVGYLAFDLVESTYRRETARLGAGGARRVATARSRPPRPPSASARRAPPRRAEPWPHARAPAARTADAEDAARAVNDGPRSIFANTSYRLLADVASKIFSLAFFVVMARELGSFAVRRLHLRARVRDLDHDARQLRAGHDPHARSRARSQPSRQLLREHLAVKLVLATSTLTVAIGVAAVAGIDRETLEVLLLLGPAVTLELLMATCFASYQAFERLEFLPVALISQRFVTAAVGIAALLHGAGVVAVSAIYLFGAALGFALALWFLLRKIARPRVPRRAAALVAADAGLGRDRRRRRVRGHPLPDRHGDARRVQAEGGGRVSTAPSTGCSRRRSSSPGASAPPSTRCSRG